MRARPKMFDWTITDPEAMLPGEVPQYPLVDRMITFVVRVVFLGQEYEFMADGFRFGKCFVWDVMHKRAVPLQHILRWKYCQGGRKPTAVELSAVYSAESAE